MADFIFQESGFLGIAIKVEDWQVAPDEKITIVAVLTTWLASRNKPIRRAIIPRATWVIRRAMISVFMTTVGWRLVVTKVGWYSGSR